MIQTPVKIAGIGSCLPDRVVTNDELANDPKLDTSAEWIFQRTGIRERHIVGQDECTSDIAVVAARRAMEMAGVGPEEIDLIIGSTITPDNIFPTLSCWLQKRLGCVHAGAFDLSAACSGFIYGLGMARSLIALDGYKNILLVGADALSKITDWQDRETCCLFADGAGAAVCQPAGDSGSWVGPAFLAAEGRPDLLIVPGGGSRMPASVQSVQSREHFMKMTGREVFKFVVKRCLEMVDLELKRHKLSLEEVKYIVPHQANQRILDTIAGRLGIPGEKLFSNIEYVGNTSSASIPIALDDLYRQKRIARGDLLLLCAFGGGLTWASSLIRW